MFFTSDSSPFALLIGCDEKQNDFFITVILWINLSSYIIKRENHTVQSVAARSIVGKFLERLCMDQAWKSINGFLWALRLARYPSTTKISQWWPWIPFSQIVAHGTYLECEYIKSINVITSHYSCCINVPHRKKDKMANPF